jgi:cobalt-zinc-cadmium efflux system membrane fusion protein
MKFRHWLLPLALAVVLPACGGKSGPENENTSANSTEAAEGEHAEAEAKEGPHGGRLLEKDGRTVELTIAEDGTPPTFQAWLFNGEKSLPATAGKVVVNLSRLGNVRESHTLLPQSDGSLRATTVVNEPHSFDVEVVATIEGRTLTWTYDSYEGRTEIEQAVADNAGIRVAPAQPGTIADEHEVQGLLTPVEGRSAKITARFPGPIKSLGANVGDRVAAGRVMAVIESNLSLSNYRITAPISGVVISRDAAIGSVAGEGMVLYEVADLSKLWVDLHIFGADAQHIGPGGRVQVTRMSDGKVIDTVIDRILPGTATASQSTVARATIANLDGQWRPGAAVKARITVNEQPTALVVPLSALQKFRDWDVVFIRIGNTYEARPVEIGKRDAKQVEILDGLKAGDQVVVEQSYLVKADVEKSGASHDH